MLEGDELRELKHRVSQSYSVKNCQQCSILILWTERGAANHAKLLETDQAWNYHEDLVEFYFTQRENIDVQRVLTRKELALMVIEAEERAEAMALENKTLSATVDSLEKHFSKGMTVPQFCRALNGVNTSQIMWWLSGRKWVFNEQRDPEKTPRWRTASYARDRYLTEEAVQITPHGKQHSRNSPRIAGKRMPPFIPVLHER